MEQGRRTENYDSYSSYIFFGGFCISIELLFSLLYLSLYLSPSFRFCASAMQCVCLNSGMCEYGSMVMLRTRWYPTQWVLRCDYSIRLHSLRFCVQVAQNNIDFCFVEWNPANFSVINFGPCLWESAANWAQERNRKKSFKACCLKQNHDFKEQTNTSHFWYWFFSIVEQWSIISLFKIIWFVKQELRGIWMVFWWTNSMHSRTTLKLSIIMWCGPIWFQIDNRN